MRIKGDKTKLIDYVFWIAFILFTNPGGIMLALGEDSGDGGINIKDFIFAFLSFCYLFIVYKKDKGYDVKYNKVIKYIVAITIYHFIIFNLFVPAFKETAYHSVKFVMIKSRHEMYSIALFFYIYRFFLRSSVVFFKVFLFSSILIITLFLVTIVTGFEILPVQKANRGFINISRMFLTEYGLMPLLIPMGAVVIGFKIDIKWRKIVLIGFGLMFLTWLLSLTRRHIFGTLIYLAITLMLNNYFLNKTLIPIGRVISIGFYSLIILFFISLSFPKYIDAGIKTVEETIYVMNHGKNSVGRKDVRLGFGKEFMQNLIKKNYVWGTGFDNRWRGSADKAGYEASDYPFLAAIAMKGVVGILFFVPIYLLLIKTIRQDMRFIKKNKVKFNSFEFFTISLFILYFVYDLIQYMNWFKQVSRLKDYVWFVYFAMYLASRHHFYSKYYSIELKKH